MLLLALLAVLPGTGQTFDWPAAPVPGSAVLANPACLNWQPDMLLSIGFHASDSSFEGFDGVGLAAPGLGLRGYWDDSQSMRTFTTGSAIGLPCGRTSIGLSYTWFDPTTASPLEGRDFWTFGISARPLRWLGVGITRRGAVDPCTGDDEDATYRGGVAVRPLGGIATLHANLSMIPVLPGSDDEGSYDTRFSAGLEVEPLAGLSFRFDGSEDGFAAGISTDFGHLGLGGSSSFDSDEEYSGSTGEIRLTSSPRQNLIPARDRFVRI
jgi:hypothetical protein